jgi:hypothetical protein
VAYLKGALEGEVSKGSLYSGLSSVGLVAET